MPFGSHINSMLANVGAEVGPFVVLPGPVVPKEVVIVVFERADRNDCTSSVVAI